MAAEWCNNLIGVFLVGASLFGLIEALLIPYRRNKDKQENSDGTS